MNRTDALNK